MLVYVVSLGAFVIVSRWAQGAKLASSCTLFSDLPRSGFLRKRISPTDQKKAGAFVWASGVNYASVRIKASYALNTSLRVWQPASVKRD